MNNSSIIAIAPVKIIKETGKATLYECVDGGITYQFWLPDSVCALQHTMLECPRAFYMNNRKQVSISNQIIRQ